MSSTMINGSSKSVPFDDSKRPIQVPLVVNNDGSSVQQEGLHYLTGFGAFLQSEALPGALPIGQQNPQKCPYNAYCELLSGTSFTTPRVNNQRTWLYRMHPTAGHPPMTPAESTPSPYSPLISRDLITDFTHCHISPSQHRWMPFPLPREIGVDFLQGLHTIMGTGSVEGKHGLAIHVYSCNESMSKRKKAYVSSDGDVLIVPQQGTLHIQTEMGRFIVPVGHIIVIPRGIVYSVDVSDVSRGYILDVFNAHFKLPELGPLGSNGLANPRDFLHPVAYFDQSTKSHAGENNDTGNRTQLEGYTIVQRFASRSFAYCIPNSPFNVIAWHGNYLPYMYDLNKFVPAGAIRIDHLDPSIFTVLTCPTTEAGVAAADFVIFPPRWAVQEHTFRPPWYHRNCMSEFMGNIYGRYEARPDGFLPGGASLHSTMVGHGPDEPTFTKATNAPALPPTRMSDDSLAFMFETTYILRLTDYSHSIHPPDPNYWKCWGPLKNQFDINDVPEHIKQQQKGEK